MTVRHFFTIDNFSTVNLNASGRQFTCIDLNIIPTWQHCCLFLVNRIAQRISKGNGILPLSHFYMVRIVFSCRPINFLWQIATAPSKYKTAR